MANLPAPSHEHVAANREAAHGREKIGDNKIRRNEINQNKISESENRVARLRPEKIHAAQEGRRQIRRAQTGL